MRLGHRQNENVRCGKKKSPKVGAGEIHFLNSEPGVSNLCNKSEVPNACSRLRTRFQSQGINMPDEANNDYKCVLVPMPTVKSGVR